MRYSLSRNNHWVRPSLNWAYWNLVWVRSSLRQLHGTIHRLHSKYAISLCRFRAIISHRNVLAYPTSMLYKCLVRRIYIFPGRVQKSNVMANNSWYTFGPLRKFNGCLEYRKSLYIKLNVSLSGTFFWRCIQLIQIDLDKWL